MSSNKLSNNQGDNDSGSGGGGGGGGPGPFRKILIDDPKAMTEGMQDLRRQGREDASAQEIIDHSFNRKSGLNRAESGQKSAQALRLETSRSWSPAIGA